MEAKLKAEELFDKYYRLFNNFPNYEYVIENLNTIQDEKLYIAKQCALIAVQEIIDSEPQYKWTKSYGPNDYWAEVKQEINNL